MLIPNQISFLISSFLIIAICLNSTISRSVSVFIPLALVGLASLPPMTIATTAAMMMNPEIEFFIFKIWEGRFFKLIPE